MIAYIKMLEKARLFDPLGHAGFEEWICNHTFAGKAGKCYMLLGKDEPMSNVPIYRRVGKCTEAIVGCLRREGVDVTFNLVKGNHFQYGLERLEMAFEHLFRM